MKKAIYLLVVSLVFSFIGTAFATSVLPTKSWTVKAQVRVLSYEFDEKTNSVSKVIGEIVHFDVEEEVPGIDYPTCVIPPYMSERIEMIKFLQKNAKQITLYNQCTEEKNDVLTFLAMYFPDFKLAKANVTLSIVMNLTNKECFAIMTDHNFQIPSNNPM